MKKEYNAGPALGKEPAPAQGKGVMGKAMAAQPQIEDYELSPEAQEEVEAMVANVIKFIHSEGQSEQIIQNLQAVDPPQAAVAVEANRIFTMMEKSAGMSGTQFNEVTMYYGAAQAVTELINIGEAAGLFEMTDDEQKASLTLALQKYFQDGIKSGKIDPVALQKDLDPMMKYADKETYTKGQAVAQEQGLPMTEEAV